MQGMTEFSDLTKELTEFCSPTSPGAGEPSPSRRNLRSPFGVMSFVKSSIRPTSPDSQKSPNANSFHYCYEKNTTPSKVECICNRGVQSILCRSCGMVCSGRVRITCQLHPNNIHLMDFTCCPNCKASQIKEFASSDSECKRNS